MFDWPIEKRCRFRNHAYIREQLHELIALLRPWRPIASELARRSRSHGLGLIDRDGGLWGGSATVSSVSVHARSCVGQAIADCCGESAVEFTREDYDRLSRPRFGSANPGRIDNQLWQHIIRASNMAIAPASSSTTPRLR